MDRDLADYQREYARQPYERYQVLFRKRKIKEILGRYPHDRMLEIGCGLESIFMAIDDYRELTVIEPAEMFYAKAVRGSKTAKNRSITVLKVSLGEAQARLENQGFDFILASGLLHELPQPEVFVRRLRSIAGPRTVIHINVPNAKSFHRLLGLEMGLIKSEFDKSQANVQFQQHTVFDLASLRRLVEDGGFDVLESGTYSFKPFTHRQMQDMLDSGALTEAMLEGFYKMERHLPGLGSEVFVNVRKKAG